MKRLALVSRAVLALVVLASLASCKGGAFTDPGQEEAYGGSGGSRSGAKPAMLSSGASYDDVKDKLYEIYEYCENHPGTANDAVMSYLALVEFTLTEEFWDSNAQEIIDGINAMIAGLS
jgi:hypothetical protein